MQKQTADDDNKRKQTDSAVRGSWTAEIGRQKRAVLLSKHPLCVVTGWLEDDLTTVFQKGKEKLVTLELEQLP